MVGFLEDAVALHTASIDQLGRYEVDTLASAVRSEHCAIR